MGGDPRASVAGPGIALAIVGIISLLVHLAMTVLNLLFGGIAAMGAASGDDAAVGLLSGVVGTIIYVFFLILQVVTIIGGFKMKNLQSYGLSMAAAIIVALPCTNYWCCLIGLPIGIWALVVLMKPEVKAAFR
jgi:hypothetical protein